MLKIGWSQKVIAMEGPVAITGQFYQRVSRKIMDPNTLTALVLDSGKEISVMVSWDLVSVDRELLEGVREAVKKKEPAVPAEKILMNATHTHTSPRYMSATGYDYAPAQGVEIIPPATVLSFLIEQASDAVVEAYRSRKEGSYAYGYGYAVVAHHRRPTYRDDLRLREGAKATSALYTDKHARMYGKTDDPMFLGYEGNVDSVVNLLFTFDAEDRLTGAIVNVPCPSQNSEVEEALSADYWHQVREAVREKHGDIFLLPQCAAAGDMSPRTLHYKEAEKRKYRLKYGAEAEREICNRKEIARRIALAFDEVYSWASKEKIREAKLIHEVRTLSMDAWIITEPQYREALEEYELAKAEGFVSTGDVWKDYKKNTIRSCVLSRYEGVISRYENNRDTLDAECHFIRLGDLAFCSNPFELYVNYQHRIQARSPFLQTFVVQLAAKTEASGYLCTAPAAENMGYSAIMYSCSVAPAGGDTLVEETLQELEKLSQA